jgi:hypothetical protein
VELPDTAKLVVVGGQPVRVAFLGPAGAQMRSDGQWPELIEGEHPIREVAAHMLDPGEFAVAIGVVGLFPGLGPLEGDAMFAEKLTQSFP